MKLSIVIPAHNEAGSIAETVRNITAVLDGVQADFEIVVVDDHSSDGTADAVSGLGEGRCRVMRNPLEPGFGMAVRCGIAHCGGDAVAVVMGDGSDEPRDLLAYLRVLSDGYDCAFGSRFCREAKVERYPLHKLLLNRLANFVIRVLFGIRYNDVTNAFKAYRRETIEGLQPLLSRHFNLTVELPLKAIARGYTYKVVPVNWYGRTSGVSHLRIKEMGSRYLFIILYVWIEKILSRGDYMKKSPGKTKK